MSCLLAVKIINVGSLLTTSRILATVVEDNEHLVVLMTRRSGEVSKYDPKELQKPLKKKVNPWDQD